MSKKNKNILCILAFLVALVLLAVTAVVIISNLFIATDRQVDLKVGDSYRLPIDSGWISPEKIQWTSNDETIVTVQNGELTAVSCGQAEVTAEWNHITATCKVLVHDEQYFELDQGKVTLDKNNDITLVLRMAGVSDEVVWSSSNEAVATVSNGKVVAVSVGEALITVKAGRFSDSCAVTVVDNGMVPSFAPYGADFEVRRTATVDVSPVILFAGMEKDLSDAELIYTVEDESVATIDADGIATGHMIGSTSFTVTGTFRGMELLPISATLEVKPNIVIALSSLDVTLQAFAYDESCVVTQQLTSAVYIESVLQEQAVINWSTEDELVATVENGMITAVGVGVTNIVATYITDDGDEIVAKVLVTVVRPEITHDGLVQFDLSNLNSANAFSNEYIDLGTFIGVYDITDEERVEVTASRDGETVYISNRSVKASGYRKYAVETTQAVVYFDALVITKVIYSYEGLVAIRSNSETLDGYYVLGADIVVPDDAQLLELIPLKQGVTYTEENGFIGTFDGKGHTITNLKVYQGGLFNRMGAATIKNVAFINVQNENKTNGAALAWECKGAIIDNVAVTSENCVKVFDYFGMGASFTNSVAVMPNGKCLIESYGSYSDMEHAVCNLFAMMGKADASTKWGTRVPGIFYNYYVTDNPASLYNLHAYTNKDDLIFDVITKGLFSTFTSSFTGRNGGIYFGDTLLCQYDMVVECPKYAVRGQQTKIKASNALFSLKTPVDGVKINYYTGVLTVDEGVPEDTEIVVVITNRSLYGVKVEKTLLVSNNYEKVDLTGTMYDFDLSVGETVSVTIDGLAGKAKKISLLDDTRYAEGVTISGNTLTVTKELLETLGYGTSEMCIFTTDDKVYHIDATIATRVLRTFEDFKAIQSSDGVLTGYYVLGNDVDMSGELFSLINGGTLHPTDCGFRGTLDGRGYAVKNAKVYDTGFMKWIGAGGVLKNIAFLDVKTAYTNASAIGSFVSGAFIENVVVTSDDCTSVINETGSGTRITNLLAVMPKGQYVINGAAIYWGTGAECAMTNIHAAMGKATGDGKGLYNKMYVPSPWTDCAAYTNQNDLIKSGQCEPGKLDGAAICYGDELVAQYILPVECPQYVIRGKSVTVVAQNATFALKQKIPGVTISGDGKLTVAASVPEDTKIVVVVTDKTMPIVKVEKTVIVSNDYKKVDLTGKMYNFDLSDGDSIRVRVSGISGTVTKLSVLDGFRYSEGVNLSGNVLTVQQTLLEQLGTGEHELCIYTSDNKVYHIDATIATRVLCAYEDFKAIQSSNGVLTGYYVLGNDVDMNEELFSLINGGELDPLESGFMGTLDGRGYAVKNAKVYDTGFMKWIGSGGVLKNIAFLDVKTSYANASVIGSFVSGALIENVVVTSDDCTAVINETGSGTRITNLLAVMPRGQYVINGAAIYWGTGAECAMTNIHGAMGKATGDGNGLYNQMYVTSPWTDCAVYTNQNDLLRNGKFAPCKLDGKVIYYGDELIAQYMLSVECPQYVVRGKSVTVVAQNATFALKEKIPGVTISGDGKLTVAASVPEDTKIVVVVTDKTMPIVKVEKTVTVTNNYKKVDLTGKMYDFDLSDGDSVSIRINGISGTVRKFSALNGFRYSEGVTLSGDVLTVQKTLLEQLGTGEHELCIYTSDDKVYHIDATIADRVITERADFQAIQSNNGVLTGYYVLGNDVDMNEELFSLINGGTLDPLKSGFMGTLDGRGYAVKNAKVYDTGFMKWIGAGGVLKNIAFLDVKTSYANASVIGSFVSGALIENVVVTSEDCTAVINETGSGTRITNLLAVMPRGQYVINGAAIYWGTGAECAMTNIHGAMGKATGDGKGLYNKMYVTSPWTDCAVYTNQNDLLRNGKFAPCKLDGKVIYYGDELIAQYVLSVECPQYVVRGKSVTVVAQNATFALKQKIPGVTISGDGKLTVAASVPEDTKIVVVVTDKTMPIVKVEKTVTVTNNYKKVDLTGKMYDFDLSDGDSVSVRINGISGTVRKFSALNGFRYSEGVTLSGDVLTVQKTLLEQLGTGEHELCIYTSDSKVYHIDATIADRVITERADFQAIQSNNGVLTGYYVLGNDVDMNEELFSLINGGTLDPIKSGFMGTLDGRGYAVKNAKVYDTGFMKWIGSGGVLKNIAFLDVKTSYANASVIGSFVSGALIENVVVTSEDCTKIVNEIGSGTKITNMMVLLPKGTFLIENAGIYWGTGANCTMTDVFAVMGAARGKGDGLYNNNYVSTWNNSIVYANLSEMINAGNYAPCMLSGGVLYYGSNEVARYTMDVSCPAKVEIGTNTAQVKVENGGKTTFALKEPVNGISIDQNGVITVDADVQEGVYFTVVVKHGTYEKIFAEYEVITYTNYNQVDLSFAGMFDLDLSEGDENSISVNGLSGTLKGLSVDEGNMVRLDGENMSLAGNKLTVSNTVLEGFGLGEHTLYVYTTEKNAYKLNITVATKVISNYEELASIQTMETLDGYYVMDADIDASGKSLELVGGANIAWSNSNGFIATFDGRGHSISNLSTRYGLFFRIGSGTVKNLALLNVSATNSIIAHSLFGATVENIVVTSSNAPMVVNELGMGTKAGNILAILPAGKYFVNHGGAYAEAQNSFTNIYAVMGNATSNGTNGIPGLSYNTYHTKWTDSASYATINALIEAGTVGPCTLDGGWITFGDTLIAKYEMDVICPAEVEIGSNTAKVTVENGGTPVFSLKQAVEGVSIDQNGVIMVEDTVDEGVVFTVVVQHGSYSNIREEHSVATKLTYTEVDLTASGMYDFDLSAAGSISVTAEGLTGTLNGLSVGTGNMVRLDGENMSLAGNKLTVSNAVLKAFGLGEHTLNVYTTEKNVYKLNITVATKVIASYNELKSIANDLSGYYILGADIDAAADGYLEINNFAGTLDGRGHAVRNLKVYQGGLFLNLKAAAVKNLALLNVVNAHTTNGAALAWGVSGTDLEDLVITSDNCVKVVEELNTGATATNCLVIMAQGKHFVNVGSPWAASSAYTDIYTVMGNASGEKAGLCNGVYSSTWTNCAGYADVNALINAGTVGPCSLENGQVLYGNHVIAETTKVDVDLTTTGMHDVDLSAGDTVSLTAEGMSGMITGISADDGGMITAADSNMSLTGSTLTVNKTIWESFGFGVHTLYVHTTESIYKLNITVATKVIASYNDLKAIANDLSGYYVMSADIDAAAEGYLEINNFAGTLDGRGHAVSNLKVYQGGLFNRMGAATIKNLALLDVVNAHATNGAALAWIISAAKLENLVITSDNCVEVVEEMNTVPSATNCVVIMPQGKYFVNVSGLFAHDPSVYTNVYAVMGQASGDQPGLSNHIYQSVWNNCAGYKSVDALVQSGNVAPCTVVSGKLCYGDHVIAVLNRDLVVGEDAVMKVSGMTGTLQGVSVDGGEMVAADGSNMSLTSDQLTITSAVLQSFGTGEHTLCVHTSDTNYQLSITLVTMVVSNAEELKAIKKDLTGYYILDADIDASAAGHLEINNFTGTIDGRGHAVRNLKVYQGGLFLNLKAAAIKNLALLDVVNAHTTNGAALAWGVSGTDLENLVITSNNCVKAVQELNTGATATNCIVIMTNGKHFVDVGSPWAAASAYTNVYTVMGNASGEKTGLCNGVYSSTWTNCASYADVEALLTNVQNGTVKIPDCTVEESKLYWNDILICE